MSSVTRKIQRTKERKRENELTKKQIRGLSKALSGLKSKPRELADETKKLFDLISLFEISMEQEQVDEYVRNQKFVVVSLNPASDDKVQVRDGIIYFPIFGLQCSCVLNVVGGTTSVMILGTDENKYLKVCTFMNFYDPEEMLKITGYYIARELAAYFNSISVGNTVVPTVELNTQIGEINDSTDITEQ